MSKRKFTLLSLIVVTFGILAPAAVAAEPVVRPGKWEISFSLDIPGLPMKMKPITMTQCLSEEDASDPNKSFPSSGPKDQNCKVTDHKVEGNKVTWTAKCTGKTESITSGEMTIEGDSYEGVVTTSTGGQEAATKIKGKRLGDCVKK